MNIINKLAIKYIDSPRIERIKSLARNYELFIYLPVLPSEMKHLNDAEFNGSPSHAQTKQELNIQRNKYIQAMDKSKVLNELKTCLGDPMLLDAHDEAEIVQHESSIVCPQKYGHAQETAIGYSL